VVRSPYFKNALKKVVDFGKGHVLPEFETLRTTLLKKTKERVIERLDDIN
jgi:hypothetical protein